MPALLFNDDAPHSKGEELRIAFLIQYKRNGDRRNSILCNKFFMQSNV